MENNVEVTTAGKPKSNAPWICGIIGFVCCIPNVLCTFVCGALMAGAADSGMLGRADRDAAMDGMVMAVVSLWVTIILGIAGFALSFFGKGEKSKLTGILLTITGGAMLIFNLISLNAWGIATGGLYLAGGITSILNARR